MRPKPHYRFLDHDGVLAFAHRGGDRVAPENTMAAFEDAVAQGYRYLETDVHASKDGVVYAFHDDNLARMVGEDVAISTLSAQEIDALELQGGQHIPRMAELFEAFPEARFNIDAKDWPVVGPLAQLINTTRTHERVCIGSFSDARIKAVLNDTGDICHTGGPKTVRRFFIGVKTYWPFRFSAGCLQVPMRHGDMEMATRKTIDYAHKRGLQLHVWTINDESTMNELLDLGVDGLMSDDCALLKRVLMSRGLW